jgi:hypothetical protein
MEQARQKKYEDHDFVSSPIGVPLGVESSRADGSEVESSPPLPSFYGGPEQQKEAEPQQATAPPY